MKTKSLSGIGKVLCLITSVLVMSSVQASVLKDLQFATLPGDRVEIKLSFDEVPTAPKGYTIEKPARIALDIDDANSALDSKYHNIGLGNARSVTVMDAADRVRVIINLTELVNYSTEIRGNDLYVMVGRSVDQQVSEQPVASDNSQMGETASQSDSVLKVAGTSNKKELREIDFRRGQEGEGQVMIVMSDPNAAVDMREEGGRILVEFIGVALPEQLRRRLDVVDFATPVQTVDAITEEGNALISIKAAGDYEYLAYQADDKFTVSVKPVAAEELERRKKDQFVFTGEKLSLNFQDIEVRSVLQLIADFTGLNLVASDTVSGRITLRLQNVPWDQALDLILKTKGLDKRKVGNVMLVAPADEIAAREKLELETTKQVAELAPLRTEFYQVNYAKAADLAQLLTGGGGEGDSSIVSGRGSITVDERTNTMILQDTGAKLEEIRLVLEKLDIPVRQVLIESRVVVANSNFTKELGVKWGSQNWNSDYLNGNRDGLFGGGSTSITGELAAADPGETIDLIQPDNLVVDLGAADSRATTFAVGYLSEATGFLELELSALEADGEADIIATPKVLTADQQTARIASGTEIPYQEASSSGATSVSFKEAVLSLEVVPAITPDERIIMDLKINQDTIGEIFNGVPSIDTNKIETSVLVDDGETVVLGGVYRNEDIVSVAKTPFFGDLPVVGRFFRNTVNSKQKQELLIFITPKLVKGVLAQQ